MNKKVNQIALALVVAVIVSAFTGTANAQESASSGVKAPIPLGAPSTLSAKEQARQYIMERARYQAMLRTARIEWYRQIGYSPLRPMMNSSYMSNGVRQYYMPSRGVLVNANQGGYRWHW